MLGEMPCFVFDSGEKIPLIIIAILGMFAIVSLTWLHRRWISRLHHGEVQRPISKPKCENYMTKNEALNSILDTKGGTIKKINNS
jgi:hypothetical protein